MGAARWVIGRPDKSNVCTLVRCTMETPRERSHLSLQAGPRVIRAGCLQPARARATLIIRVISLARAGAPRENIIILLVLLLSSKLEKRASAAIGGNLQVSPPHTSALLAPAPLRDRRRRSPANYPRNIAITIRVIGNATNFHGAYIPYAQAVLL